MQESEKVHFYVNTPVIGCKYIFINDQQIVHLWLTSHHQQNSFKFIDFCFSCRI